MLFPYMRELFDQTKKVGQLNNTKLNINRKVIAVYVLYYISLLVAGGKGMEKKNN